MNKSGILRKLSRQKSVIYVHDLASALFNNDKIKKRLVLLIAIAVFALYAYESIAAREFNIPLNWVLMPNGTSVDINNDGIIDEVAAGPAWKLTNFTVEYNLRNDTAALWNVSSDNHIFPRHFDANVGINITNPTMTLHTIGTFNASTGATDKNTSIIIDSVGNVIIVLG